MASEPLDFIEGALAFRIAGATADKAKAQEIVAWVNLELTAALSSMETRNAPSGVRDLHFISDEDEEDA